MEETGELPLLPEFSNDLLNRVLDEISEDPLFENLGTEQYHTLSVYDEPTTAQTNNELREGLGPLSNSTSNNLVQDVFPQQTQSIYVTGTEGSVKYEPDLSSRPSMAYSTANDNKGIHHQLPLEALEMTYGNTSNQYSWSATEYQPHTVQDSSYTLSRIPSTFQQTGTQFITPYMQSQTIFAHVPSVTPHLTPIVARVPPRMTPVAVPYYSRCQGYCSKQHDVTSSNLQGSLLSVASGSNNRTQCSSHSYQESGEEHLTRPKEPFLHLISQAILSSKERKMKLPEIYRWFANKHPFYRSGRGNQSSWQNRMSLRKETLTCPEVRRGG
ncbi:uncharacterized protein [Watersipora subatra]|uniref:uncharacterized protein n=1 Tax=Watersipora subatra TaxID=2589382 RepID=UPI00355B5FC5